MEVGDAEQKLELSGSKVDWVAGWKISGKVSNF